MLQPVEDPLATAPFGGSPEELKWVADYQRGLTAIQTNLTGRQQPWTPPENSGGKADGKGDGKKGDGKGKKGKDKTDH